MHRVFISSTFMDLAEHRATVQSAIRQLGAVDVSMENFGARDERPLDECVRIINEEVDSFVGIYAHRYGYVPKGDKISITEAEYDAATSRKLPRFIYIVDEDVPWAPKHIDTGATARRLATFKGKLKSTHICKRFVAKDDLATFIAADIGRHMLRTSLLHVSANTPPPNTQVKSDSWTAKEWNEYRYSRYNDNRQIFLVHTIAPSEEPGQLFDAFIYLQRHRSRDFSDVKAVDFFLGPYWKDRIFSLRPERQPIGIWVSAYGEFLSVCRVTFNDGKVIYLDRYINFSGYARSDG